jgi:hypothetical protein
MRIILLATILSLALISTPANAGRIDVTVWGGAGNDCDIFNPYCVAMWSEISGHLLFEFDESDWLSNDAGYDYQYPTLVSYEFEWNLMESATGTKLAEESCEGGSGAMSRTDPLILVGNNQYAWETIGVFQCGTPDSMITLWLDYSEEYYVKFYDSFEAASNHNMSYGANFIPEPGTLALLGIGLFGMGLARRRRNS